MSNEHSVCFYHANCNDGLASAAVVSHVLKDKCLYYPISYNDAVSLEMLEILKDKTVYIVDFSFSRAVLEFICEVAKTVYVIDHHKTAIAELAGWENAPNNLVLHLNSSRAGCVLTWIFFYPKCKIPDLLIYVEDRDMWKWKFHATEYVTTYLSETGCSISTLEDVLENPDILDEWVSMGTVLANARKRRIEHACAQKNIQYRAIAGYIIPVVNCSPDIASEVGMNLCQSAPFSATYYDLSHSRKFSLRSIISETSIGIDVSEIARIFDGGGHAQAAGFYIHGPFNWDKVK